MPTNIKGVLRQRRRLFKKIPLRLFDHAEKEGFVRVLLELSLTVPLRRNYCFSNTSNCIK
jgi:hypothetical protein